MKPNTDYTFSGIAKVISNTLEGAVSSYIKVREQKNEGNWVSNGQASINQNSTQEQNLNFTFNSGEHEVVWLWLYIKSAQVAGSISIDFTNLQVEEGTEATEYEEYGAMPSPEFPAKIENVEGNVEVTVANKNIANINEIYENMEAFSPGNCVEETVDGRDCIRFANSRFRPDIDNPFNLINYKYKENTAYTFRILAKAGKQPEGVEGSGALSLQAIYTDGTKISASKNKANATDFVEFRFVTDPSKTIARVGFNYGTSCQWCLDKSSVFIAEGDTTDYIPNEQQTAIFPLEQGQKLMLNDYLADDGIHHKRAQIELDGTEDITINHAENNVFKINNILDIGNNGSTQDVFGYYCTHFKEKTHVQVRAGSVGFCALGEGVNAIYLGFGVESTINSIEACKAYLAEQKQAGTPVIVEYVLAEEEIEPYTEEQQEAYNKLKALTTCAGQTNIYSTNSPSPIFTVTGIKDVNSMLTQVNSMLLERS